MIGMFLGLGGELITDQGEIMPFPAKGKNISTGQYRAPSCLRIQKHGIVFHAQFVQKCIITIYY
jgi:hypothetical protein